MSFDLVFESLEDRRLHLSGLIDIPSINPRPYDDQRTYNRLDSIVHPFHGAGFVDRIIDAQHISVFFAHGSEKLSQNNLSKIA